MQKLRNRRFSLGVEPDESSWGAEECKPDYELFKRTDFVAPGWEEAMPQLLDNWAQTVLSIWQKVSRVEMLTKEVLLVKSRVAELEAASQVTVPIESLAPEPFEVIRPIIAIVRRHGDEYVATFYDANVNASGETETEAVFNLKDMIVATCELLSAHDPAKLGPGSAQQKAVLEEFLRAIS